MSTSRPPEKRNPRIVYLDLEKSGGRELRRAMEQLTRALVGRLDACEKMQERMAEVAKKYQGMGGTANHPVGQLSRERPPALMPPSVGSRPPSVGGVSASPSHRGSTSFVRALYIDVLDEGSAQQVGLAKFFESQGHRMETRFLKGRHASHAAILQSLQWISSGLGDGDGVLISFIGRGCADGLYASDSDRRGLVARLSLMELLRMVPPSCELCLIIDTGDAGTPIELPYSVVAHHNPGGFEMTTSEPPNVPIPTMLLLSTYSEHPTPYSNSVGALTSAIHQVLRHNPRPTYKALISSLRDQLETNLGFDSPIPLLSSSRPFHPDAIVKIG
eukprot:TRINITY_DN869_c1_g1_i1.p1 TRINITY_DN869_c1_g1~~TRINITY_DN869_c1_g1_i1.p1  ORF type:complete len:331 (+),score=42.12 TRINITY_DN869_c1_g1_i1:125-1117(+)